MATIDIKRPHSLGKDKAKEAAQAVADRLKEKLDIKYRWDGDTLKFERTGASGSIACTATDVRVQVDLNIMLRPMKGKIEEKVNQYLGEYMK